MLLIEWTLHYDRTDYEWNRKEDMKGRIGSVGTAVAMALLVTAAGCEAPESAENRPPAQELQAFNANEAEQASFLPNAPSPRVRQAAREAALEVEQGEATFYADKFEGRRTASGRTFSQSEMVAAHRAFPFGTRLRVTNTRNGNEVEVRVVDRGPFAGGGEMPAVVDLSRAAAEQLDFTSEGRARVTVEVLEWG